MGAASVPRVVVVTRPTEYEALLVRHGTREQARFFLSTRGQVLDDVDARHLRQEAALQEVLRAIPLSWRRSRVGRADLARFLFRPDDLVVAVGQDGLVANVAKYLTGQPVVGINPAPDQYDGVLVPHAPGAARELLVAAAAARVRVEERAMVEAVLDDGQRLLSLNEVFLGHRTHQSARYRIRCAGREERQSSSGIVVATGTGATGWARSIHRDRRHDVPLPAPAEARLAYFVREAFPSVSTSTTLTEGVLGGAAALEVVSEMNEDGVVFGDGIEADRLDFRWGMRARVAVAPERLRLVRG
jgi:NAD kinase